MGFPRTRGSVESLDKWYEVIDKPWTDHAQLMDAHYHKLHTTCPQLTNNFKDNHLPTLSTLRLILLKKGGVWKAWISGMKSLISYGQGHAQLMDSYATHNLHPPLPTAYQQLQGQPLTHPFHTSTNTTEKERA